MIDKDILQMPKIKKILVLLAGFSFLQAVFIIGQAFFLSKAIVGLWSGGHLNQQLQSILLFFIFYLGRHDMLLRIFVRECSIHLVMNARKNYANNY